MNKTIIFLLFCIMYTSAKSQTYISTLPVYTSDESSCLQGLKQKNASVVDLWERPALDNGDLNKMIGSIAINPNNLSCVFFTVNSASNNTLYKYDKTTGVETNLGVTFTSAGAGTNTGTAMPQIGSEKVFGITMMTIDKNLNIGYALGKNNNLYTFLPYAPYTIVNKGPVANVPANTIPFTAVEGGGLAVAYTSTLVALVNIKVPIVDTFKYVFYEINPQDMKARVQKTTSFDFYGFTNSINFASGFCATTNGNIFASIYSGDESGIYLYDVPSNKFLHHYTSNAAAVGDMAGAGIVQMAANILSVNNNNITANYNPNTNKTKISYSYQSNKLILKSIIQASADGINFIDNATLLNTYQNNNCIEVIAQKVPHPNKKQYYRIATFFADGTNMISQSTHLIENINEVKNYNISIYPNPTTSIINISFNKQTQLKAITIIDVNGKIISTITNKGNNNQITHQIEVSKYIKQAGNYLLKLDTDNGIVTKAFTFK